jgi:uncharacterized protein (DUF1697 family)
VTRWVALLRAVNLGGSSTLKMTDLRRICAEAGFANAHTYLASGNAIFEAPGSESAVKAKLEQALQASTGKAISVLVRKVPEMRAIVHDFPFHGVAGNRGVVVFLDGRPPTTALGDATGADDEQIALGKREIYVAYGKAGIGRSKLRIPAAKEGTARNLNTVRKLAEAG